MARRLPDHHREPDFVRWSDMPGVVLAFGVALLVGLVSGIGWIAWNLLKLHVLR